MFGSLVREHRSRLGLTQEELADRSGLGLRTVRDIEAGHTRLPRQGTVRRLADAFGLDQAARENFYRIARSLHTDPVAGGTARCATPPATEGGTSGGGTATGSPEGWAEPASNGPADNGAAGGATLTGGGTDGPAGSEPVGAGLPDAGTPTATEPAGSRTPGIRLAGGAATPVRPAQLPADIYGFAGRAEQLTHLDDLLARAVDDAPTAVVISAVSGTAGVGKTTLAVHWAHQVRGRFPDGQLFVNLRGFDASDAVRPSDAVRGFLDALGVPPAQIPPGIDAQAALYRSLLADRRMLVVLDNARDAAQARPLLPGSPGCMAILTSRDRLAALVAVDGARPLDLGLLSAGEARELLVRRLGADRVEAEPEAVDRVVTGCARLPLALAIAAARAQATGLSLAALADELDRAGGRLDALDAGDPSAQVRAVFSWSYTALPPAAARLFRLLGLHPGPDLSTLAAAALAGTSPETIRPLLAELVRANLLAPHGTDRYGFHDLLRAYAADLAAGTEPAPVRDSAVSRLLDHYLHTALAADALLAPERDPMPLPTDPEPPEREPAPPPTDPEPPEAVAVRLGNRQQAMDWFSAERDVLPGLVRLAASDGRDRQAWRLVWAIDTFFDRRGHWQALVEGWEVALAAAGRPAARGGPAGDAGRTGRAAAHRRLGYAHTRLGRFPEAHRHYHRALDLYTESGDRAGQAGTHHNLALLWDRRGDTARAVEHAERALALIQSTGQPRKEAAALNAAGWYHALLGHHRQALAYCERALTLFQRLEDPVGQAATRDSLGYAYHHLGDHDAAVRHFEAALALYRQVGARYEEADTLARLGDTRLAEGAPDAARTVWRQALRMLTELEHPDAALVAARLADLDRHRPAPPDTGDGNLTR